MEGNDTANKESKWEVRLKGKRKHPQQVRRAKAPSPQTYGACFNGFCFMGGVFMQPAHMDIFCPCFSCRCIIGHAWTAHNISHVVMIEVNSQKRRTDTLTVEIYPVLGHSVEHGRDAVARSSDWQVYRWIRAGRANIHFFRKTGNAGLNLRI